MMRKMRSSGGNDKDVREWIQENDDLCCMHEMCLIQSFPLLVLFVSLCAYSIGPPPPAPRSLVTRAT